MPKKIKVLVLPSDKSGVGYYRSTKPNIYLQDIYPNDFHIDIDYEPNFDDVNYLSKYDLVHYHRSLGNYDKSESNLRKLQKLGIPSILDIDDHFDVGPNHPAYMLIKHQGITPKIINNIKNADYITTTTTIYADLLNKYNKNVMVLPNAIDPSEDQFQIKPNPSDKIRVGWLGGSSHLKDLELLEGVVNRFRVSDYINKMRLVLCGFDTRGSVTQINQDNGEVTQRPIKPEESVWYSYEKIFTDKYTILSSKYKSYLEKFTKDPYDNEEIEPYRRVWTKPISTYASNYNLMDVSLAPLLETPFNLVKSQLKMIEGGFHKKAVICQNFGPYKIDGVHEKNCLMVDSRKNHKDWFKFIKRLIDNPNMVTDLGESLYEDISKKYHLTVVSESRAQMYKQIVNKH